MKAIAFPPFLPDQSSNSGVLLEATNVVPRADGYGPVQDFVGFSTALPDAFKGGASFIAADGTSTLLAGTAGGLSKFGGGTWSSLLTGMTVPGQWRFVQFGNYAIGVNGVQTKVVDLSAATASTLTGAPAGVAIAVVGDYVVIAQDAGDLLGIYTSGFNDHTDWNPAGTGGATIQPMLVGGEVMGLAGGEYGVILQRRRIVRMTRSGDDTAPFSYDAIADDTGCASKASVASVERTVFFLADKGFMALSDGQTLKPIGSEKVDRTFQDRVARDDWERLFSFVDPQAKCVGWVVPGTPGTVWVYNYELDRWATWELPIDGIFAGFTSSVGLETLAGIYPDLDAMTISLDDPRFAGGNPRLFAVQGGTVGTLSGATLAAAFQLGHTQFKDGRARIISARPITDATAGLTLKLDMRARMGDPANVKTTTALRASGSMPIRAAGQFIKPRLEIAAGTEWTYAQGIKFEAAAGGER